MAAMAETNDRRGGAAHSQPPAAGGWLAGELAGQAGVSTDTLRHYERKGVLPPPCRRANGYRCYPPQALVRVRAIRSALAIGFTLDELAPLLRARDRGRPPCRAVRELAAAKLAVAEAQLDELGRLVEALRQLLAVWDGALDATAGGAAAHLLETLALPSISRRQRPRPTRKVAPTKRKGES